MSTRTVEGHRYSLPLSFLSSPSLTGHTILFKALDLPRSACDSTPVHKTVLTDQFMDDRWAHLPVQVSWDQTG